MYLPIKVAAIDGTAVLQTREVTHAEILGIALNVLIINIAKLESLGLAHRVRQNPNLAHQALIPA